MAAKVGCSAYAAVCAVLAGCGGGGADATRPVTVYAASSLREALPAVDAGARYSFGGSGALRLQIERGAPADVFVAASLEEPAALAAAGRCGEPRTVAANRLVMLVPRAGGSVGSVEDLRRGRLRLAVGAPGVPAGDYARGALAALGLTRALNRHVVSSERDVAGVTAKVADGSADAGFAYATDARAAAGRVRAVDIPERAGPPVRYAACVVLRDGRPSPGGRRYLARLASADGTRVLAEHGFDPPPGP